MRIGILLAAAAAGLFTTLSVSAQEEARVDDVEGLLARADFDQAEVAAGKALTSGTLTSRAAARVYLALGTIAAARGVPEKAEGFFRNALVIDPGIALPPSAGPHVVERFLAARRARDEKAPLTLALNVRLDRDPSVALIDVEVRGDPEGLAHRVVLRGDGVDDRRPLQGPGIHFAETLPDQPPCVSLVAGIVDEWGNELWPALARETVCRATPPIARKGEPALHVEAAPSRPPLPASVWVTTGVASAGFAVATTAFALVAAERQGDLDRANADPQSTVQARNSLKGAVQTLEYATVIAGAATLGSAIVTVTLLATRPGSVSGRIGLGVRPVAQGAAAFLFGDL